MEERPSMPVALGALFTSVGAVVRAKELAYTEAGELIHGFMGNITVAPHYSILWAVQQGSHRLLRLLVAMQRPARMQDVVAAIRCAARHGRLDLLAVLYRYNPEQLTRHNRSYWLPPPMPPPSVAEGGARETRAHVANWSRYPKDCVVYAIAEAASKNHVEMVEWLFARLPTGCTSLAIRAGGKGDAPTMNAIEGASKHGRVQLLQLFHTNGMEGWTGLVTQYAATAGHLHVVEWMAANRPEDWSSSTFIGAVANGHLAVVKYAHGKGVCGLGAHAAEAAGSGNLDMIKWFLEHFRDETRGLALAGAVSNGQLEIIQFLQNYELPMVHALAINRAAMGGHLNVIKWMYKHRKERCTINGLTGAISNGHLEVVKFLLANNVFDGDPIASLLVSNNLAVAAANGHLNTLQFILEDPLAQQIGVAMTADCPASSVNAKSEHKRFVMKNRKYAMDKAATNGHLDVVRYLHEHGSGSCTTDAMDGAAKSGHLEIVRYLHETRTEGCTADAMKNAASNGHLPVIQYLYEHRSEGDLGTSLDCALAEGHFEIAKWLRKRMMEDDAEAHAVTTKKTSPAGGNMKQGGF